MKKMIEAYANVSEAFDVLFLYKLWINFKSKLEAMVPNRKNLELTSVEKSDNIHKEPNQLFKNLKIEESCYSFIADEGDIQNASKTSKIQET